MKFNCGPTWREKFAAMMEWHVWFAWYPVRLGETRECLWLEKVERKANIEYDGMSYEYRALAALTAGTGKETQR